MPAALNPSFSRNEDSVVRKRVNAALVGCLCTLAGVATAIGIYWHPDQLNVPAWVAYAACLAFVMAGLSVLAREFERPHAADWLAVKFYNGGRRFGIAMPRRVRRWRIAGGRASYLARTAHSQVAQCGLTTHLGGPQPRKWRKYDLGVRLVNAGISCHMKKLRRLALICLAAISTAGASIASGSEGWFGLALNVDAGGFFLSPTVRSAKVIAVVPNSPAAMQGLKVGDQLLEIEGLQVVNGDAKRLQAAMEKKVGDMLRLELQRPSGEIYVAVLTAAKQPNTHGDP